MKRAGPRRPQFIGLAVRSLGRELRAGEVHLLALALVIAVAAMSAVGFFTDRVHRAIFARASEMLGADLVVSSPYPIGSELARAARAQGLHVAHTLSFRSTVLSGQRFQLVAIKAVSAGYPLRGQLRIAARPYGPETATREMPAPGSVWLDPRLMSVLDLTRGGRIRLGDARFRVAHVISFEPDRGGNLFNIAPRVLMNLADVPRTGLVQEGSRVTHRLLLAGPPAAVAAFRAWLRPRLDPDQQLQDVHDTRPQLRTALDRASRFLSLAALTSVLLAGAAIALATRRYVSRRQDAAAVMRCLGARQGTILRLFGAQMLLLGLAASLIGCGLGYAAQGLLATLLGRIAPGPLPAPSLLPLLLGMAAGLVTLAGFALPPLVRLRDVPPARVLRRDMGAAPPRAWVVYGAALAALASLVLWYAGDVHLAGYVLGGALATVAVLALAGWALVRALAPLRTGVGVAWRFGLANIARHARGSTLQVVAFGLGIMALLLLTLVRTGLLAQWQRSLPPTTPNYFLINIQPDQVPEVGRFLHARGLSGATLYPMVRGRLVAIGDHAVSPDGFADPRARRLAEHEFNLSWARALRGDNRIAAGHWWDADTAAHHQFSVEQGLAETLGIRLGDELTFRVAGEDVHGRVTSLRAVNWDSFQPNFFVLAPPTTLAGYPATWITSFHLAPQHTALLTELVRKFPSVTVLDVDALLTSVRDIMARAVSGVEYVFLFALLAGFTVLFAAIQATLEERRFETAIVRTLGADRRRLLRSLLAEFATVGLLAGVLAAAAATAVGAVLAHRVFDLTYHPDPAVWVMGIAGGTLGVGLAGVLGTRSVLDTPPLETLRRARA